MKDTPAVCGPLRAVKVKWSRSLSTTRTPPLAAGKPAAVAVTCTTCGPSRRPLLTGVTWKVVEVLLGAMVTLVGTVASLGSLESRVDHHGRRRRAADPHRARLGTLSLGDAGGQRHAHGGVVVEHVDGRRAVGPVLHVGGYCDGRRGGLDHVIVDGGKAERRRGLPGGEDDRRRDEQPAGVAGSQLHGNIPGRRLAGRDRARPGQPPPASWALAGMLTVKVAVSLSWTVIVPLPAVYPVAVAPINTGSRPSSSALSMIRSARARTLAGGDGHAGRHRDPAGVSGGETHGQIARRGRRHADRCRSPCLPSVALAGTVSDSRSRDDVQVQDCSWRYGRRGGIRGGDGQIVSAGRGGRPAEHARRHSA